MKNNKNSSRFELVKRVFCVYARGARQIRQRGPYEIKTYYRFIIYYTYFTLIIWSNIVSLAFSWCTINNKFTL